MHPNMVTRAKVVRIREAWAEFLLHLPDGIHPGVGDVTEAITEALVVPQSERPHVDALSDMGSDGEYTREAAAVPKPAPPASRDRDDSCPCCNRMKCICKAKPAPACEAQPPSDEDEGPVGAVLAHGGIEWYKPVEEGAFLFLRRWNEEEIIEGQRKAAEISHALAASVPPPPSKTTDWRWMRLRGYLSQWLTPHQFEIAMDCLDKAESVDKDWKERIAEVARQELQEPETWHYVSFADKVFHGAVIIMAHGVTDALSKCHRLNINPGGEVMWILMPDEIIAQVPEADRNRLLTREDVQRIWPDAKTIREHEEKNGGAMRILEIEFLDGKKLELEIEEMGDQGGIFGWRGDAAQAKRYGYVAARDGKAVTLNGFPPGSYDRIDLYPLASIRRLKEKNGGANSSVGGSRGISAGGEASELEGRKDNNG